METLLQYVGEKKIKYSTDQPSLQVSFQLHPQCHGQGKDQVGSLLYVLYIWNEEEDTTWMSINKSKQKLIKILQCNTRCFTQFLHLHSSTQKMSTQSN